MFSSGWQATHTRSIVASAASLNRPSSSAVMSPTLFAMTVASARAGGFCARGAEVPAPMTATSTKLAQAKSDVRLLGDKRMVKRLSPRRRLAGLCYGNATLQSRGAVSDEDLHQPFLAGQAARPGDSRRIQ